MAAVVLLVLLDAYAELPINLNQTFQNKLSNLSRANLQVCKPETVNYILDRVKNSKAENPGRNMYKSSGNTIENLEKVAANHIYNEDTIFESPISDFDTTNSLENAQLLTANDLPHRVYDLDRKTNFTRKFNEQFSQNMTGVVQVTAPNLVAIFETLSNVTAQTCAGTLLAPHWVITAASCVNILSNIRNNKINSADASHYTVVAGSTNPLVDGSTHNVTEILLHPEPELARNQTKNIKSHPVLAMMKIEPAFKSDKIRIWSGEEKDNINAKVYGWTLSKNDSGADVMKISSMPVRLVSQNRCQGDRVASTSALCLDTEEGGNNSQLTTGGPVLAGLRPNMIAILREDRAPGLAEPLDAHRAWVQRILNKPV